MKLPTSNWMSGLTGGAAKAALALLVRAIELPAPHHREFAAAVTEAPHQESGRAPGRTIIQTEVAEVIDAGDVGQNRDHGNFRTRKLRDRFAHERMIEHLNGDAR